MTRADAAKLVAIVVTAYPNYDKFRDANAVTAAVDLWAMMFAEDNGGLVGLAVKKHIATSKWPPSVAEIRELMLEIAAPDLIPPDLAWLAVSDALAVGGEYNGDAQIAKMPPLVARAVEAIGWGELRALHCSYIRQGKPGNDRLTFIQQYQPMYERERLRAMTPAEITAKIDKAAAAITDGGRGKLAALEAGRREQEENYRRIYLRQFAALGMADEIPAIEEGGAGE